MKKLGLIAGILLVLASCNKDQRAANKLEGTWNVTNYTISYESSTEDPVATGEFSMTLDYNKCDTKSGDGCTMKMTLSYPSGEESNENFTYVISEDGEKVVWSTIGATDQMFTINELSKDKAVLFGDNTFGGLYDLEVKMEKIE